MDIQRSPLTGYSSQKTDTPRQSQDALSSSEATRIKEAPHSTESVSIKLSDLKEGQLLKGQIIDHRYQEVKLLMEPGKQIISAKLSNNIPLSIGEEATFQVSEDPSKQLVLKYIPSQNANPMEATVVRALQASKLPMNDRNKAIASELLNHRMPLDKQTLQTLIRLSYMNKEASPLTLVLMLKHKLPMIPSNIKQFEAYQKGTHQLLKDIKSITHKLSSLIDASEAADTQVPFNGPEGSHQFQPATASEEAILRNAKLLEILENQVNTSSKAVITKLSDLLDPQELSLLKNQLEQTLTENPDFLTNKEVGSVFSHLREATSALPNGQELTPLNIQSKELLSFIGNGSISIEDTLKLLEQLNLMDGSKLSNALQNLDNTQALDQILSKLTDSYVSNSATSPVLTEMLKPTELEELLQSLQELPNSGQLFQRIQEGKATLKEALDFLRSQLPQSNPEAVGKLLSSPGYHRLLEEAFMQKWSITPKEAAKKENIEELYQKLQEDLEEISKLMDTTKDTETSQQIKEPVKNLQDNLHFLKDLNEAFTFLQLPVQFKDQKAHTELYVLSKKKSQKTSDDSLRVLLHLEMQHLGPINVFIQLVKNQINTTFYLEDKQVSQLFQENLHTLTDVIKRKGYHIHAEIKGEYKKPNFCADFIEQNAKDYNVQQYNFDIRT